MAEMTEEDLYPLRLLVDVQLAFMKRIPPARRNRRLMNRRNRHLPGRISLNMLVLANVFGVMDILAKHYGQNLKGQ